MMTHDSLDDDDTIFYIVVRCEWYKSAFCVLIFILIGQISVIITGNDNVGVLL